MNYFTARILEPVSLWVPGYLRPAQVMMINDQNSQPMEQQQMPLPLRVPMVQDITPMLSGRGSYTIILFECSLTKSTKSKLYCEQSYLAV